MSPLIAGPGWGGLDRRLAALGGGLVLLVLAGLALHHPGADKIRPIWLVYAFVGLLVAAGGLYGLAIRHVLRAPPSPGAAPNAGQGALWTVLTIAAAMRACVLPATPFLSSDVYRYVWDGRVEAAGINPYRYLPIDPALQSLRDAAIYPHVNRREYARTIYPPTAQLVFRVVAGLSDSVMAMKATMVAFEALAVWALMLVLAQLGLPPARVLIYAWNPLGVWAFAGNGHVDALAIGLLAVVLLLRSRRPDSPARAASAGALLAAAALVKFLPVIILPAIWPRRDGGRWDWRRWDWQLPAAFAVTIVALYAVYAGIGWAVFGYLGGYGGEEGLNSDGFYLIAALRAATWLPSWATWAYLAVAAGVLIGLGLRFALRSAPLRDGSADVVRVWRRAAVMAAAVLVVATPHYPWYFVWLALPCCVCPLPSVIFLSIVPAILYLNPWDERLVWPSLIYLPFAVLAVRDFARRDVPMGDSGVRNRRLHWRGRPRRMACRPPA